MELYVYILMGIVGFLTGAGGAAFALKRWANDEKFVEICDFLLTEVTENVEWQKRFYVIGGLVGNGIRKGVGIGKTGGKFKIEDVLGQVVSSFINKAFGGQDKNTASVGSTSETQDLNIS